MASALQPWVEGLPLMQQSVLLAAVRGADGTIHFRPPAGIEIAWAAGLFEGEGCFSLGNSARRRPSFTMQMKMTDEDVVRRFAGIVGHGAVYGPYMNRRNPTHKPVFSWAWGGRDAGQWALANFGPFLGARRLAKLCEILSVEGNAPYATEGFRRAFRGIHSESKCCTKCLIEKPNGSFSKKQSWCRQCCSLAERKRRLASRKPAAPPIHSE